MAGDSLQRYEKQKQGWELAWNTTKEKRFNRNRLYNFVLIAFGLGLFSTFFLGHKTLVSAMFISKVMAFCCVAGLLIPWSIYHRRFGWYKMDVFIVNLFGLGPFLCGLLLALNFFIHSPKEVEHYKVEHTYIEKYDGFFSSPKILIELEGDAYKDQRELTLFDPAEIPEQRYPSSITYTLADGLFGYRVVLDWEMRFGD